MKTMYEIELVRVDKNGAITFSNSENANFVDQLDEVTETLEEAQARANELQYKFYVRNDYDRIIINEIAVDEDGEILDIEYVEEMEVA